MIEGVTFDWWNTLAMTTPEQDRQLRSLRIERLWTALEGLASRGPPIRRENLLAAYDRQTDALNAAWARNVDMAPSDQVEAFLRLAGLDGYAGSLHDTVSEAFGGALLDLPPSLFPHAAETLGWLKREGFAVGLVSNTGRTWGRYLRRVQDRIGIGKFFDARIFSDEVGIRKPEAGIFQAALSEMHLPPEAVVHVGDDVAADVAGAKALGLRAIWFNTGFWRDVTTDSADAEVRDHAQLPALFERWRA